MTHHTPDPPEALEYPAAVTLAVGMPLPALIGAARTSGSFYAEEVGARALEAAFLADPAVAVRMLQEDIDARAATADEQRRSIFGTYAGPLDPAAVAALIDKRGWSVSDAASVVSARREIARIEDEIANPPAAAAAWLDVRPLAEPPRPWSQSDWERDRRRAQSIGEDGVELSKHAWLAYAEAGLDAVSELRAQHYAPKLEEAMRVLRIVQETAETNLAAEAVPPLPKLDPLRPVSGRIRLTGGPR